MPVPDEMNLPSAYEAVASFHSELQRKRNEKMLEVFEAILLAVVAVITAWNGYQAGRWGGRQSFYYGRAARLRVEAQTKEVTGHQAEMYDALTVAEWLKAEARGDTKAAELFERRLLPEFRPAFETWKRTDPAHNPKAPVGPVSMTNYQYPDVAGALKLNQEASEVFDQGTQARELADQYLRATVFLTPALLLVSASSRFQIIRLRTGIIVLAYLILFDQLLSLVKLPNF